MLKERSQSASEPLYPQSINTIERLFGKSSVEFIRSKYTSDEHLPDSVVSMIVENYDRTVYTACKGEKWIYTMDLEPFEYDRIGISSLSNVYNVLGLDALCLLILERRTVPIH